METGYTFGCRKKEDNIVPQKNDRFFCDDTRFCSPDAILTHRHRKTGRFFCDDDARPDVKLTAEVKCESPHRNLDHHFPDGHRIPYRDTWLVDVGGEEDEHDRAIGDVSVRFVQIVEKDNIPFAVIFLRRNSIIQCTGIYVFLARDDILNVYICTVGLLFRIQLRFIF